jgi:predicted phage baseplate assembly protein
VTQSETQFAALSGAVNFVKALGGADSETLEEAKIRARKQLSTRNRAVTASDFEFIAKQTPGVRVARVVTVPLKRPLVSAPGAEPASIRCGALPAGPAGLDDSVVAHGAVSVVVVPDEAVAEPLPTRSFLRAVCVHLNRHRLITTEVYVVPPQYLRLCRFRVTVKGEPGYTRARLQDLLEKRLGTYLHALTGGDDGPGYPFGSMLHAADLVALLG